MPNLKSYAIKVLDGILILNNRGNAGDIDTGTAAKCTINGTMKGTGMVVKGSFTENYLNTDISRVVNVGEMFSTNMGNTEGVTITANEDGSENLIIMPRIIHTGGIIITEHGKLLTDEEVTITGSYLVIYGAGIEVDGVQYPLEDGFKVSDSKTIKGLDGETFYMSYNRIDNPEEFVMLRTATDQTDVAVLGS